MMDEAIMREKIEKAVPRHSSANPFERMPAPRAGIDQRNRNACEHNSVQVVFFEPASTRLMVRFVPSPAPAVHNVFMGPPCENFHGSQRSEEYEGVGQYGHVGPANMMSPHDSATAEAHVLKRRDVAGSELDLQNRYAIA